MMTSMQGEPQVSIGDADSFQWDDTADVVIVGYGGAGICAALELVENGASVIAIDRFNGGGATAFSGGVVYAAGTDIQRQNGVVDDPDNMMKYLRLEVGDVVKPETLKRFCEQSAGNLQWLQAHGVVFGTKLYTGKTTYPPEGYFLQYSGNEKVEAYCREARPAPRGHRTLGRGFTGNKLYRALRETADRSAISKRLHTIVQSLVVDGNGRVVGVAALELPAAKHAEHQKYYDKFPPTAPFKESKAEAANKAARAMEQEHGQLRYIRAKTGVILSTGGFVFNLDMLSQHAPTLAKHYKTMMRLGTLGDDGTAVKLGTALGADTVGMDAMFVGRVQSPPAALLDGILVNQAGDRFANEAVYVGTLGRAIAAQPEGKAWLIMSTKDIRKAMRQVATDGVDAFMRFGAPAMLNLLLGGTKRARDLDVLAEKCGINPNRLRQTVRRYEDLVRNRHDDDFSKLKDHLKSLGNGPYVAMNVSLANRYSFITFHTLGGLALDEATGAVRRADGSTIPGLYAAGRATGSIPSRTYISGLSLADCVFTGRRAAQSCLQEAKQDALAPA